MCISNGKRGAVRRPSDGNDGDDGDDDATRPMPACSCCAQHPGIENCRAHYESFFSDTRNVLKARAYCVFPHLRLSLQTCACLCGRTAAAGCAETASRQFGRPPAVTCSFLRGSRLLRYMQRCVVCDRGASSSIALQGGGLAALEYIHYCSGDQSTMVKENVQVVPRVCCFECAAGRRIQARPNQFVATVSPFDLMRFLQASDRTSATVCRNGNAVMAYAQHLAGQCTHCTNQMVDDGDDDNDNDMDTATGRRAESRTVEGLRDIVDSFLATDYFEALTVAQVHALARRADKRAMLALVLATLQHRCAAAAAQDPHQWLERAAYAVARFLENLSNALVQDEMIAAAAVVATAAASVACRGRPGGAGRDTAAWLAGGGPAALAAQLVQIRYPFSGFAYQYRHRPGLFTYPRRFCSSICQHSHSYAKTRVMESTSTMLRCSVDCVATVGVVGDIQGETRGAQSLAGGDDDYDDDDGVLGLISADEVTEFKTLRNLERAFLASAFDRGAPVAGPVLATTDRQCLVETLLALALSSNQTRARCNWCGIPAPVPRQCSAVDGSAVGLPFVYCTPGCRVQAFPSHSALFGDFCQTPVTSMAFERADDVDPSHILFAPSPPPPTPHADVPRPAPRSPAIAGMEPFYARAKSPIMCSSPPPRGVFGA